MQPLSPLDGRYALQTDALRPFFTEEALMRARVEVEVKYFIALSQLDGVRELKKINSAQERALYALFEKFNASAMRSIKDFEKVTKHDVKAVEYYLKEKVFRISGLKLSLEFIHFGLTSEDVNNLAYGILISSALKQVIVPSLQKTLKDLTRLGNANKNVRMLSLTHGQPATPTTLGKEMLVFAARLGRQIDQLRAFKMQGKLGGAVGNFSAHKAAYPDVAWEKFRNAFVRALGLIPLQYTTQINPHDDLAELSHTLCRINTIMTDFSRDVWMYISRGIFGQLVVKGEVGSSAMPHKVNPIDFENAEGNLGLSSALFSHFAEKLPISRLQRDLSDSTVQRNIGVAFGYHLLAVHSLAKGVGKLSVNRVAIRNELLAHPEVAAEAIQTVLRKNGVTGAYEKLKALTRGERVTAEKLHEFVLGLEISKAEKEKLLNIVLE
jgi:adenylosuccinate lyase